MATYVVRLNQNLIYEIEVEADDEDQAIEKGWGFIADPDLSPAVDNSKAISAIRQPTQRVIQSRPRGRGKTTETRKILK